MNAEKLIMSAIAGIAFGATAGVLLSTDKGSALRKKLMKKSENAFEDLESKFNVFVDSMTDQIRSMKAEANLHAEVGKEK